MLSSTATDDTPDGREACSVAADRTPLWNRVAWFIERVISTGSGIEGLLSHKLAPLAVDSYERSGIEAPAVLHEEKRSAVIAMLMATPLLKRVRESVAGPLVVLKGPEVAALYPPGGRRFSDIDVLSPLAPEVQASLLRSGFVEVAEESYSVLVDHHHLQPIRFPAIWLDVEVHSAPSWPRNAPSPPPLSEILEAVVPAALGIDGVSAPNRLHHALLLAAHAWTPEPLSRMRDLIDIAALAEGVPENELAKTAHRWGIGKLWHTTWQAIHGLLDGEKETVALRLLGPHLRSTRERTVFENHLLRWLYPYWELPPRAAFVEMMRTVQAELAPAPDEAWRTKLTRTAQAIRRPRASAARRS